MPNYKIFMRIFTFLIFCLVLIALNKAFGQYRLEIIDSMIVQAKGNAKTIIIDNHLDERQEFIFNDDGKMVLDIQSWFMDLRKSDLEKTIPDFCIDTVHFSSQPPVDIRYNYSLKKGENSYLANLYKTDTSYTLPSFVTTHNGDSTIYTDTSSAIKCRNTFVGKNGYYTSFQSEFYMRKSGEKSVSSWNIYYEKDKVFFIDQDYFSLCILYYKNYRPVKLEFCANTLFSKTNTDAFLLKNYRKMKVEETIEIRYGNDSSCLENEMLSFDTMERFKKAYFHGE